MKTGDFVLIVEEETPQERAQRTGKPVHKKHQRKQKVAFFDRVKAIKSRRATFEADADAETTDAGRETAASRQKRQARGEPEREAVVVDPAWFKTPFGPPKVGTRIDIDEMTLARIKRTSSLTFPSWTTREYSWDD